jgi:hypothetical protein
VKARRKDMKEVEHVSPVMSLFSLFSHCEIVPMCLPESFCLMYALSMSMTFSVSLTMRDLCSGEVAGVGRRKKRRRKPMSDYSAFMAISIYHVWTPSGMLCLVWLPSTVLTFSYIH